MAPGAPRLTRTERGIMLPEWDAGCTCRHREAVMEARVSWVQDPLQLPAGSPVRGRGTW